MFAFRHFTNIIWEMISHHNICFFSRLSTPLSLFPGFGLHLPRLEMHTFFKPFQKNLKHIVNESFSIIHQITHTHKLLHRCPVQIPPKFSWILNYDGSFNLKTLQGGIGGILRDASGNMSVATARQAKANRIMSSYKGSYLIRIVYPEAKVTALEEAQGSLDRVNSLSHSLLWRRTC